MPMPQIKGKRQAGINLTGIGSIEANMVEGQKNQPKIALNTYLINMYL